MDKIDFNQGFCEMQYNVCPDSVNNPGHGFTLTGAQTSTTSAVASFTDSACIADYLLVPCGTDTRGQSVNSDGSVCAMRMCGSVFNSINAQVNSAPVYSKNSFVYFIIEINDLLFHFF